MFFYFCNIQLTQSGLVGGLFDKMAFSCVYLRSVKSRNLHNPTGRWSNGNVRVVCLCSVQSSACQRAGGLCIVYNMYWRGLTALLILEGRAMREPDRRDKQEQLSRFFI